MIGQTKDGMIEINDNGQFVLVHPSGPDQVYDFFYDLVEDHPCCEKYYEEINELMQ